MSNANVKPAAPPFDRVLNPLRLHGHPYFVHVRFTHDGRLSITAVHGPRKDGDAYGGCGQHSEPLTDPAAIYAEGWTRADAARLAALWDAWHLNDMRAACEHQRALGWTWTTHPDAACPTCGYMLGHSWLREEVPANVLAELQTFPKSTLTPAWI